MRQMTPIKDPIDLSRISPVKLHLGEFNVDVLEEGHA